MVQPWESNPRPPALQLSALPTEKILPRLKSVYTNFVTDCSLSNQPTQMIQNISIKRQLLTSHSHPSVCYSCTKRWHIIMSPHSISSGCPIRGLSCKCRGYCLIVYCLLGLCIHLLTTEITCLLHIMLFSTRRCLSRDT